MTKTFTVTIKELSKCIVDVEAKTEEEALDIVQKEYWKAPINYLFEPYETSFEI